MVLPQDSSSTPQDGAGPAPSLAGDAAALLGAVAMAVYIWAGAAKRKWMPLWLFAFPVTASAAVTASLASLALEPGVSPQATGPNGWFGWSAGGTLALFAFLSGAVSGILGHSLALLSLGYLSPLLVSVSLLGEPVLGSAIGWAAGRQGTPSLWTALGGLVLLMGVALITVGSPSPLSPSAPRTPAVVGRQARKTARCIRGVP